jgi:hypothetical protein
MMCQQYFIGSKIAFLFTDFREKRLKKAFILRGPFSTIEKGPLSINAFF